MVIREGIAGTQITWYIPLNTVSSNIIQQGADLDGGGGELSPKQGVVIREGISSGTTIIESGMNGGVGGVGR